MPSPRGLQSKRWTGLIGDTAWGGETPLGTPGRPVSLYRGEGSLHEPKERTEPKQALELLSAAYPSSDSEVTMG